MAYGSRVGWAHNIEQVPEIGGQSRMLVDHILSHRKHKESELEVGQGYKSKVHLQCHSPSRLYVLTYPQPPQTSPPTGNKAFNYPSLWETFLIHTTTYDHQIFDKDTHKKIHTGEKISSSTNGVKRKVGTPVSGP